MMVKESPFGASPAKFIDNCTNFYKQLSELSNLKESGFGNEEYYAEREAIMNSWNWVLEDTLNLSILANNIMCNKNWICLYVATI